MGSIELFRTEIDNIYGTYLDACTAFGFFKAKIEELQRQTVAARALTLKQLDQAHWRYGLGNPNEDRGGLNAIHQARMAMVSIYQ